MSPPELRSLLAHLARAGGNPFEVLTRLNAQLTGTDGALRVGHVAREHKLYPYPGEVPAMLALLFERLARNFNHSDSLEDDLASAALAFYGVTAIHPFPDGNGRTALAFAQYLLMVRQERSAPLLELPAEAHRILGQVLSQLEPPAPMDSGEAQARLHDAICQRLGSGTPEALRGSPVFADVLHLLGASLVQAPAWDDAESVDLGTLRSS